MLCGFEHVQLFAFVVNTHKQYSYTAKFDRRDRALQPATLVCFISESFSCSEADGIRDNPTFALMIYVKQIHFILCWNPWMLL